MKDFSRFQKWENPGYRNLKDFYTKNYPTDGAADMLYDNTTFGGLLWTIVKGNDVYKYMGVDFCYSVVFCMKKDIRYTI